MRPFLLSSSRRVSGEIPPNCASICAPRTTTLTPSPLPRWTTTGPLGVAGFVGVAVGGKAGGGEFLNLPQPPLGNGPAGERPIAVHCTHNTFPSLSSATTPRAPEIPLRPAV